ncbi:MAG: peptidase M22 [Oscillospiraceae bacterium]
MSDKLSTLGIDTSNYTCSAAYFNAESRKAVQAKQLLPVKSGEKGIRQSDAVFHHTMLIPEMLGQLSEYIGSVGAIGVSDRPSCREGSYMPCFMTGLSAAKAMSLAAGIPYFTATHQTGHILAALYSADKLDLINSQQQFLAFHVSGGTTDLLLCTPDKQNVLDIKRIGGSADLKAGQAIDRCGVMLGLDFPCGKALERLAESCDEKIKITPSVKGLECSLSGLENKCRKLFDDGADSSYIASFCLNSVAAAIFALTKNALSEYGNLPVLYAGGVMSDKLIADRLKDNFDAYFASPEFSCDNAVGAAIFAAIMKGMI